MFTHGRRQVPRVVLQETENPGVVGEPLRIGPLICVARQLQGPVRELEAKGIPSLGPPALTDPPALEDEVVAALLLQHPTHREPGLTSADDNNVLLFPHAQLLGTGDPPGVPTACTRRVVGSVSLPA